MPGNGPAPKQADQRRRRNKPAAGDWVHLPAEGRKGAAPTLPKTIPFNDRSGTESWWREIWRSPMATQWASGDIPALIELAILRDCFMTGQTAIANEVRLRSDQFGLTPEGRQKRRWLITDEDALRAGLDPEDELAAKRAERRKRVEPKLAAKKKTTRKRKTTTSKTKR